MKLSIFCLVYNHEKYLRQAIDSFLMQKTTFDFEIVIGEDFSTDNSRAILLEYKQLHPTKFKLLLHEKNIGMAENVIATLNACEGEYVALCEGDDYWTDPLKLQKQVDFLEKNKDYSICYHRVNILDESLGLITNETLNKSKVEFDFDINYLATGNKMNTQSVVFRNQHLNLDQNSRFKQSPASDYFLHMLNAQFGRIKYFPDVMAVYRVNSMNSVWSSLNKYKKAYKWLILVNLLIEEFSNNENIKKILYETYFEGFKKLLKHYTNENKEEIKNLIKDKINDPVFLESWTEFYLNEQIPFINKIRKRSLKHRIMQVFKFFTKQLKKIILNFKKL